MNFNLNIAKQLLSSPKEFPVDFEQAWQWLEYANKANAKRFFDKAGFISGMDYVLFIRNDENVDPRFEAFREAKAIRLGRPLEQIYLTVNCFKTWAMMSKTVCGARVREYFLDCERRAKGSLSGTSQLPNRDAVVIAETILNVENSSMSVQVKQKLIDQIVQQFLS